MQICYVVGQQGKRRSSGGEAGIPFCGPRTNQLAKIFKHKNIRLVIHSPQNVKDLMRSVKDPLGLQVPWVHQIPCLRGKVYIGQAERTVIRGQEYKCHLRLGSTEKSAIAQHWWDTRHAILLKNTMLLHKSSDWHERLRLPGPRFYFKTF